MIKVILIPISLALAIFLTFCGTLRFVDGFGVGEFFLLAISLMGWSKSRKQLYTSPFVWFFVLAFFLMSSGYIFNNLIGNWIKRDAIAYLYTGFISFGLLLLFRSWSKRQLEIFVYSIILITVFVLWFGFYIYIHGDIHIINFLHMDNQGDGRYTAWSTNPNQLALLLLPMPVWLLMLYPSSNFLWHKFFWYCAFFSTILIGLVVRSDALLLSWFIGAGILICLDIVLKNLRELRILCVLIGISLSALVLSKLFISGEVRKTFICSYNSVAQLENPIANGCIKNDVFKGIDAFRTGYDTPSNKAAIRIGLWKNAIMVVSDSPLIGHGPGAFSWYDDPIIQKKLESEGKIREEAHNILLDLMTQGGVFLGAAWVALLIWLMLAALNARVPYAFTWVFMIGFFTLFMYHLRHPYLWVILIFAYEVVTRGLWSIKAKTDTDVSI